MSVWTPTSSANWPAFARSPSAIDKGQTDSGAAGRIAGPDPLEPALLELTRQGSLGRRQAARVVEERLGVLAGAAGEGDVRLVLERSDSQPRQPRRSTPATPPGCSPAPLSC